MDTRTTGSTSDWHAEHPRRVLSASTLTGDRVRNNAGEDLGTVDEIMIDTATGRVAYAVLSYGGFLGMGDKLFAIPWRAFTLDQENKEFVLDISKQTLEAAPGFDKGKWPDMTNPDWESQIHSYYGVQLPSEESLRSAQGSTRRIEIK